jgi:hypothetical protein
LEIDPSQSSLRDENRLDPIPALKRRAKFMPTLRVEYIAYTFFSFVRCAEGGELKFEL